MHVSFNGAQSLAQWFNVHEGSTNNCLRLYRSQHNFQLFQTVSLPPPVRHQTKGKNASVEEAPYFPSVIKLGSRRSSTSMLMQKTNTFFIIASTIYKFDDTNALYNIKLTNTFVVRLIKTPFTVSLFAKCLFRGVAESFCFNMLFSSMPSFSCASLPFHFPSKGGGKNAESNTSVLKDTSKRRDVI